MTSSLYTYVIKKTLYVGVATFALFATAVLGTIAIASARAQSAQDLTNDLEAQLISLINSRLQANDVRFKNWVLPGQLGTLRGTPEQQITAATQSLAHEVATLYAAFATASDGQKEAGVISALTQIDERTAIERSTRIFPRQSDPPMSWMRTVFVLPIQRWGQKPAERVFSELTNFELFPKSDDIYYIYNSAFNLPLGYRELQRHKPIVEAANLDKEPVAVKKCRDITLLGWFCNTNHYIAAALRGGADRPGDPTRVLFATLANLNSNADHPDFNRGDRNVNTAKGYTGLTLVSRVGDSVLIYFSGIQHAEQDRGFHDRMDEGQKEEAQALLEYLQSR